MYREKLEAVRDDQNINLPQDVLTRLGIAGLQFYFESVSASSQLLHDLNEEMTANRLTWEGLMNKLRLQANRENLA